LAGQLGLGGDEFAAEGFGEDRLGDLVGAGGGRGQACLDGVGELEQGVHAADDFVLFGEGQKVQQRDRSTAST
jgi:hypothetical protein